jgi:hypothetical protein
MPAPSLPVSIPPTWRWGPLETDAAQYYQAVGERLVAERTAQASINAVVLQDPQRQGRILSERGWQPHAHQEGPTAAKSEIIQTDYEVIL